MKTAIVLVLLMHADPVATTGDDVGPFVRALQLVQRFGTDAAADPRSDVRTKGLVSRALGKAGTITSKGAAGLMEPSTFAKLAGSDGILDDAEIRAALAADLPASRSRLLPKVVAHFDYLATSFDLIDAPHREAGAALARWIAKNHQRGRSLDVVVVCTGNSRRSILGATMGNIAAAYCGLPEVRFHSGGTAPTAFNPRTIASLEQIGVEIKPTGEEAPRGEPRTANPRQTVRWGRSEAGGPALETVEFSKHYADTANPHRGFAALMVCSEADASCPTVNGASLRLSMPYLDPKLFDDSPYESIKYGERRDDIGRLLLSALSQARRHVSLPTPENSSGGGVVPILRGP